MQRPESVPLEVSGKDQEGNLQSSEVPGEHQQIAESEGQSKPSLEATEQEQSSKPRYSFCV